ncbi:hypothetical protein SS1G_08962 [Sclerotinia sclerotiorum 1980 UF-70]|uniref:Reverse transcriptase n=1 Tax=Sclerotinia sclerotiorum (strain ATCC 18683 / 1980 / Ss-1) TaxID=665079 RepID=A7EUF5_SCLS1|nr:hypothetical protein SS1G_08962 [Sclerotinia sclerotiorum 1980 UF-70]EDN93097.1 hypothetical protein SS1G_08962 [Sclerotinia sclerotiorum 1980 UF-70]
MTTQKSPTPHEEQEREHNIVPDLPESVSQGKRRERRLLSALDAVDQGLLPDMAAETYNFLFGSVAENFERYLPADLLSISNEITRWSDEVYIDQQRYQKEIASIKRQRDRLAAQNIEISQSLLGAEQNEAEYENRITSLEAEIVDLRKAQSTVSPQPAFKIPDPEFFESSSTGISWEQWKDKMMNKIRASGNSDPVAQLAVEEVFATLEDIYGDPNKKQDARRKYNALYQRDRPFPEFYAEFQLYASTAEITDQDQLLEDLTYKLSNELNDKMITSHATTLTEYVKDCQKFDYLLQQLKPAKSGKIYVNKKLAFDIAERTNLPLEPIKPRIVYGYNQQKANPITQRLKTTLTIGHRKFPNVYLYVIEELACDLIIGREWLAQQKVLLDVARSKILWPGELMNSLDKEPSRSMKGPTPEGTTPHRIALINAIGYRMNTRNRKNQCFTATSWEIDQILYQREHSVEDRPEETELETLQRTIPKEYHDLIDLFSKKKANALPPHRNSDHKIRLTQPNNLTLSPLYRQTTQELQALKKFIDENLNRGWIAPSNASFAAPILFVKKANGDLRLCVDYRKLNEISAKDGYPLPRIDEILSQMSKAKIFTKLDLRAAFNAIRMHPDSEELTAFQTCFGQFKSLVLPFGLSGGPGTYQRFINNLLMENLGNFCTAYLDDIIIYSTDPSEHTAQVRWVLTKLKEAGLSVDIKKCDFSVSRIKYLGFYVSTKGLEVDPEKIKDILTWKRPTTVKGVRGFLGFCGFYRKFIKNYGRIARPLDKLTQKGRTFDWDPDCQKAFETLRQAVTEAPVLHYFHPDRLTKVETDSSDGVTGGILSQLDPATKEWHPLAFFSKTMNPAECNYEIHDKEMLAILQAFQQWRVELQSVENPVQVYSDHQSLEIFMRTKKLTARQARWAEYLSQFNFQLEYRTGKANGQADALTRRDGDIQSQKERMEANRLGTLLKPTMLSPEVRAEVLAPLVEDIDPGLGQMLQVLQANRTATELGEQRTLARTEANGKWTLVDGLLLRSDRGPQFVSDFWMELISMSGIWYIRKLGDQMSGPYRILERRGNAFKLELPAEIKVHPYFNPEKLRKAAEDPLPGQVHAPPIPEEIDGNLEWEVEKILSVRKVYGLLRYRVKWRGFDTDIDEYSPTDLKNSPLALKAFHNEYPDLPGPPKNLNYWLECALEDKVPEDRLDDNEEN